jgi:predicted 3-demethylubiquinone-9 3-methyltransferase (glyoxalase superfamily)
MTTSIIPNLWFDGQAEEAAEFYCSVFPNSRVLGRTHYPPNAPGPEGSVMTVDFVLEGTRFTGINGGPQFTFSEAVSFLVECEDQAEIDRYWAALTDGGEEGPCGWCKDRFGLSWQVVPKGMDQELDEGGFQAMMGMKKLDVAALRAASGRTPA